MNSIHKILLAAIFLGLSLFAYSVVYAADFIFENDSITLMQGDEFELKVIVDAKNNTINTLGGRLLIPNDFLEIKEIISGESGINFWIQQPSIVSPDQIVFSGMVPGGFNGKMPIFSAIFKAKKVGITKIFYAKTEAYLHDGLGTSDIVNAHEFKINIEPRVPKTEPSLIKIEDNEPPENFYPEIIEASKTLGVKYAVVFSTTDKKSGIDHFEILERRVYKVFDFEYQNGEYITAESPYYLNDQKLKSEIFIKAVDKRGNSRVVRVLPSSPIYWYENPIIWGIIILLALVIFALFCIYAKKFKKHKIS